MTMTISYKNAAIKDLVAVKDVNDVRARVTGIEYKGDLYQPTDRFWTSVCSRFGFNPSIFKYFSHREVFDRISDVQRGGQIGITIENSDNGQKRLLGVSAPNKPVANHDDLISTLQRFGAESIKYADGIITSQHTPRVDNGFTTVGDAFKSKFYLNTPIDGYGSPSIYLGLLRLVCSNGMIALSKAFKSDLSLGKGEDDVMPAITRALDSFNNDEGYAALQSRIEASSKSWASMHEANSLQQVLFKLFLANNMDADKLDSVPPEGTKLHKLFPTGEALAEYKKVGHPIFKAFHTMTGDTSQIYGLANIDAISQKKQRVLPVKCTTYDLLNFATEVATHYSTPAASSRLQAWMGEMISNEFDMEGTVTTQGDFVDVHLKSYELAKSTSKN